MENLSRLISAKFKNGFLGNINIQKHLCIAWWIFSRSFVLLSLAVLILWNTCLANIMINLNMNDFGKFYYSALSFIQGRNMYEINPAIIVPISVLEYGLFLNLNPPHFIIMVMPLAFFSQKIALLLWSIISLFSFLASLFLIFREAEIKFNFWRVTFIFICILAFAGTGAVVATGQLSFIMMLPLTLFWLDSRRGRWSRAAFYLGLSMSIKLFLMIFLPYLLLRKQWRALIIASGVTLSCYFLGIMILGWDNYRIWLNDLQLVNWSWAAMNGSIQGFFARLLAPSPYFQPLLLTKPVLVKLLWVLSAGLIGVATLGLTVQDKRKDDVDRSYALLLVAAQLISPLGWIYYSFLSFGPLILLGVTWHRSWQEKEGVERALVKVRNVLIIISFLGFVIPLTFLTFLQPSAFMTLSLGSAYFWATLALWTGLCFDSLLTWKQVPPKLAWEGEMNKEYSLISRFSLLNAIALSLFLLIILIFVVSGVILKDSPPVNFRQVTGKTGKIATVDSHESDKLQPLSIHFNNDFYAGRSYMADGEFQKAREHFTNYLRIKHLRTDSDIDIANLIGLGLACGFLEDYRFSEGYFLLAAKVCLQRRYMLTPAQSCNYFSRQIFGFSSLEPFIGLMRLSIHAQDISGGFFWSEKIHALKIMDKMGCQNQEDKPILNKGFCEENRIINESIVSIYNQMISSLDFNDRKLYLELISNLNELLEKYPNYASDINVSPLKASEIPLEPGEAFLEYIVTEQETFAWLAQNHKIIKNIIIPVSRSDLETKIKKYTYTAAASQLAPTKTDNYDPNMGAELYALLMKELLLSSKGVEKIIIVPDEILWELPFEKIVTQSSAVSDEATQKIQENQPLRNSLVIKYYQSAKALQVSRQKK